MSASALVTIFCDAPSCGAWWEHGVGDTAALARRGLRGRGWRLAVKNHDGKRLLDFCPKHAKEAPDA